MKVTLLAYVCICIALIFSSCSDAEFVSGKYQGQIYTTDTVDASILIVRITENYIRIETTSHSFPQTYVEYAKVEKSGDQAYSFTNMDGNGGYTLTGYYFEKFIHVQSWSNNFAFDGTKP